MEGQLGTVDWMGEPWGQQGAEEGFAEGVEQQLLGEGLSSMTAWGVIRCHGGKTG